MISSQKLGATTIGTTPPDIIIAYDEGTMNGRIAGMSQIIHNPAELKVVVDQIAQEEISSQFADAILQRRQALQSINDVWNFPLSAQVPCTSPTPWTVIQANEKAALQNFKVEYNIMKNLDFNGRNFLRIELPPVSLYETNLLGMQSAATEAEQANNMYLGAWYRDLIPRIVKEISLYPRSSASELFKYSGYAIYIHNLIFGNERKEMNDLMAGEDKFELCYDPYRVEGSALGLNSFKGLDIYRNYNITTPTNVNGFNVSSGKNAAVQQQVVGSDGLVDFYIRNDMMDVMEFNDAYRKNVYYEAPIAQNYNARHSIHSRRVIHNWKVIGVPLDILPFGYSPSSALATAALAGECGYLSVTLYSDWLSRAFYCTKLSNIPPSHPITDHVHYEVGDFYTYKDPVTGSDAIGTITEDNDGNMVGWVNRDSLGRSGDPEFIRNKTIDANTTTTSDNAFNKVNAYATPNVIGRNATAENIVQAKIRPSDENGVVMGMAGSNQFGGVRSGMNRNQTITVNGGNVKDSMYGTYNGLHTNVHTGLANGAYINARNMNPGNVTLNSRFDRSNSWNTSSVIANYNNVATADASEITKMILNEGDALSTPIVYPLQFINYSYHTQVSQSIAIRLFQICFQTLDCISTLLTRMPNLYICTEWAERDFSITPTQNMEIQVNNDLYQIANVFWFIPTDQFGVESMRVYPPHMINHEMPLINLMRMQTQLGQGQCTYDWHMLNIDNPAYMGLNPLQENIGIMSFSPEIHDDQYPLAFYDPNIAGELKFTFECGNTIDQAAVGVNKYSVNLRSGYLKVLTIGINGVGVVNMSLYRIVY